VRFSKDFLWQNSALAGYACLALMVKSAMEPTTGSMLLSYVKLGYVVEQSKDVQEPHNDYNHNNGVQDAFDLTLHGDETVYEP
jgi:hypothetical protein